MITLLAYLTIRFGIWSIIIIHSFFIDENNTIHNETTDEEIMEIINNSWQTQFGIGLGIADLIMSIILLFAGYYTITIIFLFIGWILPIIFRHLSYKQSKRMKVIYKIIILTYDFYILYYFLNIYLYA